MTTQSRVLWAVLTALLLTVSTIGWFFAGLLWLVDFDDSDPSSARAGVSAMILTITIAGAIIAGVLRRNADGAGRRATCIVLLAGGIVATLPWLGAL